MQEWPLLNFGVVDALHESTDAGDETYQALESVVPRPMGGASRPPLYAKLWNTADNWASLAGTFEIDSDSKVVLFRVVNEAQVILAFMEYISDGVGGWLVEGRGMFYGGESGAVPSPVTFTASGATVTKLGEGYTRDRVWRGFRHGPCTYMGNGVDPNLIYQTSGSGELREAGSDEVPPEPVMSMPDPIFVSGDISKYLTNVILTYWDEGADGYGYESPQSVAGDTVIWFPATFLAPDGVPLNITVTAGTTRAWTHIRIYLRYTFPDSYRYFFYAQVPNVSGTHIFPWTGSVSEAAERYRYTQFGRELVSKDNKKPPACSIFEWHDQRLWMSGNIAKPQRVWVSKTALNDELMPEGIDPTSFLNIQGDVHTEGRVQVTAMHTYRDQVAIHTRNSLTLVDPQANFFRVHRATLTGAINQACVVTAKSGATIFLGNDLNLHDVDSIVGQALGDTALSVRTATSPLARGYIRKFVDIAANIKDYQYPALLSDPVNGLIWVALNQSVMQSTMVPDGRPTLFCWDGINQGMTGPFYAPTVQSGAFREIMDGRMIIQLMNGTLCVWSLAENYTANALASSEAFTYLTSSSDATPRPTHETFPGGSMEVTGLSLTGPRLAKGHVMKLCTQWLEFGEVGRRKNIRYLEMVFVRNSRCHLWVDLYVDHSATPLRRVVGQLYMDGRQEIRLPVSISGHRLRVEAFIGVAEDKPCALRSWKIGWELQGGMP